MASKKYRLTSRAQPFERDSKFQFRLTYSRGQPNGGMRLITQSNAPIITIDSGSTVSSSDVIAQMMIEKFNAPVKTFRNGEAREAGPLFVEDHSNGDADLNLDDILI